MLRAIRQPPRPLISPKSHLAHSTRSTTPQWLVSELSTQASLRNKQQQQTKNDRKPDNPAQPELPAFSLEGLGVSRNMKIVLFTLLGIYGTIETYFYCKWIYHWWYGDKIKAAEK